MNSITHMRHGTFNFMIAKKWYSHFKGTSLYIPLVYWLDLISSSGGQLFLRTNKKRGPDDTTPASLLGGPRSSFVFPQVIVHCPKLSKCITYIKVIHRRL